MKILVEIGLFSKRKILETLRQPVWIISELMTPLLYILLFSPLLKNMGSLPRSTAEVLNSFVPGLLTLLAFSTGMGSGWTIIHELDTGVIERLRVTPASRFSILMGTILTDILDFLVPSFLVLIISSFFGFTIHPVGLVIMLALLCLLTAVVSAFSSSLGLILKQIGSIAAVLTSLQLPLTLLSGILLPLSMGPVWLRVIAHINPMYYTVEASRFLSAGVLGSVETLTAFAVTVPLTVITLVWATGVYRKTVA